MTILTLKDENNNQFIDRKGFINIIRCVMYLEVEDNTAMHISYLQLQSVVEYLILLNSSPATVSFQKLLVQSRVKWAAVA
ncbi:uncharacterized protein EAF01_000667 [Botrytis porri]|uniref:Uncharacterized protein n=1 Tax=Botrytis porri TaxID=87229 RepID=A0A4Z1KUB5_9HELO|nr:uncharacterized protein EAF01_000667 [Botrytis porri]KAF7914261.1 hypothetical protein EAF01_000667 [Botrytis porri]TGO88097.1 hypothetical protein BPOR_0184g00070 [Botrytis porri]